jgi:NAD(P)H-hydrate epimerase
MLPSLTAKEMAEIDRLVVEELGIGLLQMMEHAGRNLTEVARILLGGELAGWRVVVLAGPGNNGGGGIGYSLNGPPRGAIATLIREANGRGRPILALDLPSGLHPDTGEIYDPSIRALATLTLALPKRGLLVPTAKPYVGRLWVGDIGVPPGLYGRVGLRVGPLFSRSPVVPVEGEADAARKIRPDIEERVRTPQEATVR